MSSPPTPHQEHDDAPAERMEASLPDGRMLMDGIARWILSAIPAEPDRVPYVRRQVDAVLHLWGVDELAWAVELVVTELAANVVRHARTLFSVRLFWNGSVLHGEVSDANPMLPRAREAASSDDTGGRGLMLVGEIADTWGIERHERGKTVWFDLRLST